MGLKLSTTNQPRLRTYSASSPSSSGGGGSGGGTEVVTRSGGLGQSSRARARSLGSYHPHGNSGSLNIPGFSGAGLRSSSPDSDSSSPDDEHVDIASILFGGRPFNRSLPVQLFSLPGVKCPVCSKQIASDDIEYHLVLCLTKPCISYNEDVLPEDKGECVICFEELTQGDTIARLPCLCIYHKGCIDRWFQVNRSCPEHPSD